MPIERAEILERIRALAVETRPDLDPSAITESATFATLGLDSIRMVELGVRLEQMFGEGVVLDDWIDEEAARGGEGYTVGSLLTFIERSLAR